MLIYSLSLSVDGFIADREGAFNWAAPNEDLFRFHVTQTRELGGFLLGRRLYETMLVWETDPSMRDSELDVAFRGADLCKGGKGNDTASKCEVEKSI
jgi:dihydrofolate reductase